MPLYAPIERLKFQLKHDVDYQDDITLWRRCWDFMFEDAIFTYLTIFLSSMPCPFAWTKFRSHAKKFIIACEKVRKYLFNYRHKYKDFCWGQF